MTETFSLFIEDFTHLDCAILHPQRGPIGYSWILGIEFVGNLNEEGIVFDFSKAKKTAKKVVDATADHAFIVPENLLQKSERSIRPPQDADYHMVCFDDFLYSAPRAAFFTVPQVTEAAIIAKLELLILEACRKDPECATLVQVKLKFIEENNPNEFYYHYTHGLKQSQSPCSRLMHGHRSTIQVFNNGVRDNKLEKEVSLLYADKHLLYWKNIPQGNVSHHFYNPKKHHFVSYVSYKGEIFAFIPKSMCMIYPLETTVEEISRYTSYWIKEQHPELEKCCITVRAFEGVQKGSIYTLPSGKGTQHELSQLWREYDLTNNCKTVIYRTEDEQKLLKG